MFASEVRGSNPLAPIFYSAIRIVGEAKTREGTPGYTDYTDAEVEPEGPLRIAA